jgi:hypothetical protein
VLKLPVAAAGYLVAGWTWLGGLSGVTYPLRWEILDQLHVRDGANPFPGSLTTLEGNLVVVPLGVALLIAAPWLTRAVVSLDGVLITRLIGPMSLTERVRDLEQTRAHATAEAEAVQCALELVDAAHNIAKEAIIELRDLAHGIHPPVLDRGLNAALATLAARSAVPVELVADLSERPSAAIEAIAYFCAAELLANVAKHSGAGHATLDAVHGPGLLRVRVSDDGHGGARVGLGSGMAGLIERLRTVDGRMTISSPLGGPTVVTIELPSHA